MAVFTIAGLVLKEAVRRKTLIGALLLGLLVLGLSLILILIHQRMLQDVARGRWTQADLALRYPVARSIITSLCLSSIKSLGALFAVLLAGGSISSEIERGLLAVILPKPIYRWQILIGKWIGLNIILMSSVLLWTTFVWASMTLQTHAHLTAILHAGLFLMLFPLVVSTLTLSFSTFAQRLFGTSLALTLMAFSWFDGIFSALGYAFNVDTLQTLAVIAGLTVPQGYIGWWVDGAMKDITFSTSSIRSGPTWESPRFLTEVVGKNLHIPHMDVIYVVGYVVILLGIGIYVFQKRDV